MKEMREYAEKDILSADAAELHELFTSFLAFLSKNIKEDSYQSNLVAKIARLLFDAKLPAGRIKNQKFDFSMASDDCRLVRFSYNDFGEREGSYDKYLKIYEILNDFCDLNAIKKILDAMPQKDHQTTFGAEIAQKKEDCRFKLYFEDMAYGQEYIRERLKDMCLAAGYDCKYIMDITKEEVIGAIGLDFTYGKKTIVKLYCSRNNLQEVNNMSFKKFKDFFQPKEGEFYYLTYIFKDKEKHKNKIYKVFNAVKNSQNNDANIRQIHNYLLDSNQKDFLKLFKDILSFTKRKDIILIPVLFSADEKKQTFYFTFRKNHKRDY